MNSADLEVVYEKLAHALDATEASKRELLLAKLALLLAHNLGDAQQVCALIEEAKANLDTWKSKHQRFSQTPISG